MKIGTTDPKSGHPLSTTLSSLSVREKKEAKPNPPIPHNLSAPALNGRGNKPTPSSLAETTASKNQQGDRGDGTSKIFLHEKTPPFSGLEKISEKTLEKKGEKVSSKKSSTEVEKVSENSLVPTPHTTSTTTTTTTSSGTLPEKTPPPVSVEKELELLHAKNAAQIDKIEADVREEKKKAFLLKGGGT